jgi:hypothetical protein
LWFKVSPGKYFETTHLQNNQTKMASVVAMSPLKIGSPEFKFLSHQKREREREKTKSEKRSKKRSRQKLLK